MTEANNFMEEYQLLYIHCVLVHKYLSEGQSSVRKVRPLANPLTHSLTRPLTPPSSRLSTRKPFDIGNYC